MNIPLEHIEAVQFHSWLTYENISHWHIQQETYTKSWRQKRKMKEEGVTSGISDYLIFLDSSQSLFGRSVLLFIELKRQKRVLKNGKIGKSPSSVSQEQLDFLKKVHEVQDVEGFLAYGFDEAREFVRKKTRKYYKTLKFDEIT